MTKEINTYEEYVEEMTSQINELTNKLYSFKKTETDSGRNLCTELAGLTMNLGSVGDSLRGVFKNNIPVQDKLLDQWLGELDVQRLDVLFLVAFLRYTFVARKSLTNWIPLRDKTAIKIDSIEGKESKKILIGLYS